MSEPCIGGHSCKVLHRKFNWEPRKINADEYRSPVTGPYVRKVSRMLCFYAHVTYYKKKCGHLDKAEHESSFLPALSESHFFVTLYVKSP